MEELDVVGEWSKCVSQTHTGAEVFKGERSNKKEHLCHQTQAIIEAMDQRPLSPAAWLRHHILSGPFICTFI